MAKYVDMEKYIDEDWVLTKRGSSVIRVIGCKQLKQEDVSPAKKGVWIRKGQIEAYCSHCGAQASYKFIGNEWDFEDYCAHCGARNIKEC